VWKVPTRNLYPSYGWKVPTRNLFPSYGYVVSAVVYALSRVGSSPFLNCSAGLLCTTC